ncbi:uncharacterized protein LOC121595836 [Anopheles merus]|uniref:uncharacterized protein LOC121595836 n=1 Tax=Anopheles merus TaxID=30066 RepID=UPI001BE43DCE|nr:uncharacterized protein LOC121595836 [Anopheles merus]
MDLSNKDATGCGSDSSNDGHDLASASFYELDRPALSFSPMETDDGPAASASPIPPLPASPEQQVMDLSVGGGPSARTTAQATEAGPVNAASASFGRPVVLLQDEVKSRLIQRHCSVANLRSDTIMVIVGPSPMGAAGHTATPARQAGAGLGAIRHRRNSTAGTSTAAAGGQLRRCGRTRRESVKRPLDDMAAEEWENARSGLFSPRPVRPTPAQEKAASDDETIACKQREADAEKERKRE